MKKFYLKLFSSLFIVFFGSAVYAQVWNISESPFGAPVTYSVTTTVGGLTMWSPAGQIAIDANPKTLDEFTFTHRLKLGGAGTFEANNTTPIARVVSFPVTGNSTITVIGMSSSSGEDRTLVIASGDKTVEVGRFTALGASISRGDYNYTGGPTTIFLFSLSSGINLYYIKATDLTTGIKEGKAEQVKIFPNPATGNVSVNMNEPGKIKIYNSAGILMKQQLASPSLNTINVSDLNPGMYFVKIQDTKIVEKLIIR